MKRSSWFLFFLFAAFLGIGVGYLVALAVKPSLLPPILRWGCLTQPTTVLFLGVDVVYKHEGRGQKGVTNAFNGRSDTILVVRLNPIANSVTVLSIPRDTFVRIDGFGFQKINAANALGGVELIKQTVQELIGVPIDHYLVLNVYGLIDMVNELGGITVEIPKRMKYMDWTAKLKIDLEPGFHTLTGNQAMGFVRFRHDVLGDIGRVQRQELFMRAVMDKALQPSSWTHIPRLMEMARHYILTDMNDGDLLKIATFVKAVPKDNLQLVMMPGQFSGTGDWLVNPQEAEQIANRLMGSNFQIASKTSVRVSIENTSSYPNLANKLAAYLKERGYIISSIKSACPKSPSPTSRIIAQKANPEEAQMIKGDLNFQGQVVYASIGDIDSNITIYAGDDLAKLLADVKVR